MNFVIIKKPELQKFEAVSSKDIKSFMKKNGISSSKPDPLST